MSEDTDLPSYVEYADDVANAEAPAPLPVGKYHADIVEAKPQISATKGTKYAAVTFLISPEQYPADYVDGSPEGAKVIYRRVSLEANPMAMFMMKRFLKAIDAPMGRRIDTLDWVGRKATVEIAHTTYEGQLRHEIKAVEPA